MVESTCFQHTSSHPDKYNNSVVRIISKEEEREDPRRDSSIYLRVQVQWCFHKYYKNYKIPSNTVYSTVFLHAIQSSRAKKLILHTEINTTPRTTRLIPCHPVQISTRHLPATAPRVSKHSTRQTPAIRLPTAFQGHTVQAGFQ